MLYRAMSLEIGETMKNKMAEYSARIVTRILHEGRCDRGDVPGWVLVTVMTAGLVVAIWSVADGQLKSVLGSALRSVSAP
jgi:hypothetical protein